MPTVNALVKVICCCLELLHIAIKSCVIKEFGGKSTYFDSDHEGMAIYFVGQSDI